MLEEELPLQEEYILVSTITALLPLFKILVLAEMKISPRGPYVLSLISFSVSWCKGFMRIFLKNRREITKREFTKKLEDGKNPLPKEIGREGRSERRN